MLLIKSVSPEDMGEIKFTAEKASSTAKLKVKGKKIMILCTEIIGEQIQYGIHLHTFTFCVERFTIMLKVLDVGANGFSL